MSPGVEKYRGGRRRGWRWRVVGLVPPPTSAYEVLMAVGWHTKRAALEALREIEARRASGGAS